MNKNVIIYTTSVCPYCSRAKQLLARKKVNYQEIDASEADVRQDMIHKSGGKRTVPQIFIGDFHVGGCDDLYELEESGELDKLLS